MANIEKELADAYGEIIDVEIEAAIAEAKNEPHEFSPKFKKQMEELIRTGKPNNKRGLSKRGKRILIIAIAAVLALVTTACAIPEIRESIVGFFVKVFNDHVEYSDPDVTKETIEEEYGLVPIPEGFIIIDTLRAEASMVITYSDDEQNCIVFTQLAGRQASESVDSDHGSFSEYELNGKKVRIKQGEDDAHAAWVQDGYYFSIDYPASIDLETFESWIVSVKTK